MDKKSKIFMGIFFLLIVLSVGFTYYRIMLKRDYVIEAQTDCDPTAEKCFVYHCDSTVEECTGDETQDTSFYKISRRKANLIPTCDPADENCQPFVCGEGEKNCEEVFCDEQTAHEGEECNDPVQYAIDNPPAEEDEEIITEEDGAEDSEACDSAEDSTCEEKVVSEAEDDSAPSGELIE